VAVGEGVEVLVGSQFTLVAARSHGGVFVGAFVGSQLGLAAIPG
jgi:hypothetical protein